MKKVIVSLLLVVLFVSHSYAIAISDVPDRYEQYATDVDGNKFYIDIYTVKRTENPNIIRYWSKQVVSDKSRKQRGANEKNKYWKNIYQKTFEIKTCIEIDTNRSMRRVVQGAYYSRAGKSLHTYTPLLNIWEDWEYIVPDTVGESGYIAALALVRAQEYKH